MPSFASNPTTSVFDWNVFEWGFHVMDVIPNFTRLIVQREFKRVLAGQAVTIECYIEDLMTTPGERFPFNPATTPQIKIYKPDDTVALAYTNMNFSGVTGNYNYQHQILSADQKGFYKAQFKAVNGTMTGETEQVVVFEVI